MSDQSSANAPAKYVIAAFAVIYIVWGSTFFFIKVAVEEMPVTMLGTFRFVPAGLTLILWSAANKEKIWQFKDILNAFFSGFMLLFIANGAVAWAEQYLASSIVAVFVATSPMWFVILDYKQWKVNFNNFSILIGLFTGFVGIIFLFGENLAKSLNTGTAEIASFLVLAIGSIAWAGGSLYSKYRGSRFSGALNSGWQMMGAAIAFAVTGFIKDDWLHFEPSAVSAKAWLSILYLITMGSLIGYSAFVWLLKVRPATQVSTHSYVNPVVAVLLGVYAGNETVTWLQILGLGIILLGVLLVNLSKFKRKH